MTYIRRTQKYQLLAKMYSTTLVELMYAIKTAKEFAKIKHRSDSRSFLTTEKTLLGLAGTIIEQTRALSKSPPKGIRLRAKLRTVRLL